ncbi:MAG: alpha-N-acetylglucosaminidase TIM-barrel domain-containing protein, partial [Victivallaceae bacterium]
TGLVWDIRKERNLNNYFKLTETHIKEYGKPEIFHTIGLAERKCFASRADNLKLKLLAYRLLNRKLREHYPNAPLLIASWDFPMYWEDDEVKKLIAEFDPDKTILFDYTAESMTTVNNFTKWGVVKKFPWIFGIFHAYEPESDIRGDYNQIMKRFKIAAGDKFCKGMAFWPELSHSDTFMLEFFSSNAWCPSNCSLEERIGIFCRDRYGVSSKQMAEIWQDFMPLAQLSCFYWDRTKPFRQVNLFFFNILTCNYLNFYNRMTDAWKYLCGRFSPRLKKAPEIFVRLAELEFSEKDEFIYRDIMDIARTTAHRVLFYGFVRLNLEMEKWRNSKSSPEKVKKIGENCFELMTQLGEFLGLHHDYSLYYSFLKLGNNRPVNPVFENTLKGNAENDYCRSFIYELFQKIYIEEIKVYLKWITDKIERGDKSEWKRPEYFRTEKEKIQQKFYDTPLQSMAPLPVADKKLAVKKKLITMSKIIKTIVSG